MLQPLRPGDPARVGRYRLGGRLGDGGMGQVFWGRSPSGRPVAVKIVHPYLAAQPEFRRRFAHEVEAARRVGGFHTAPVVDADPDGDPPWLVTAYVAGPSLAAALQRSGPFPLPALRTLGAGLAEALEAVHAAGLVHRDLKPGNILLVEDGPRVIDFGIARAFDTGGLTATGMSVGTPRFMAPEQFGEEPVTGAAVVFAWGTVLCHAAGIFPFGNGPVATVAGAILTRPPVLDGLPGPLRYVVSRSLDKDPARRPSPARLLDELSDGASSIGWLPPPVRAMLAEHVVPDALPGEQPDRTPAEEETARLERPASTRIRTASATILTDAAPPARPAEPPPPAARRRGPLIVAAAAVAALFVAVVVLANLPRSGTGLPNPKIAGTWLTSPSDGSAVTVTIELAGTTADTQTFKVNLAVDNTAYCGGASISVRETVVREGDTLPVTWQVTCPGSSSPLNPYQERYFYDPAADRLTDAAGNTYRRG